MLDLLHPYGVENYWTSKRVIFHEGNNNNNVNNGTLTPNFRTTAYDDGGTVDVAAEFIDKSDAEVSVLCIEFALWVLINKHRGT